MLTNLVPPYRAAAYDALHHHAQATGGGLRVLCTQQREPQRNWSISTAGFAHAILPGMQFPLGENRTLAIPFGVTRSLRHAPPDALILAGFGLAQWQAQNWALGCDIPTIVQFDGWSGSDAAYANPVRHKLRKLMIARADGFIAAGSRGAIWFEKHGAPAGRIGIAPIPPSFPPPGFTPGPNVSDRHYDLLWCGRTTTSKGFDVFVKIATELVKGDPPRRIAIIGSPDIAKTTKDAISAGLKDQADIFGLVPPEQLPAFLTNSKIALFPSRNDAYGVGVIDAITCGALALASPMTGCAPDVLKPSETLPIDVPQRWVLACKQLLNDAKRYQNTRQQQASAIADNNPLHHGKAIWDAACDAVKCRSEIQQWG